MSTITAGDLVTVHDPEFGDRRGRIVDLDDTNFYIEGGPLDDVRVWTWTIARDKATEYLTKQETN